MASINTNIVTIKECPDTPKHRFIVTGDMSVGSNIKVEARPVTGYDFVEWFDGDQSNPRFFHLNPCSRGFYGSFEQNGLDVDSLFNSLLDILGENPNEWTYQESYINNREIIDLLNNIL